MNNGLEEVLLSSENNQSIEINHNIDFDKLLDSSKDNIESFDKLSSMIKEIKDEKLKESLLRKLKIIAKNQKNNRYMNIINNTFNNSKIINEKTDIKTIASSLYGFAVGDALGVPVEFLPRRNLQSNPVTKMLQYGTHNQPIGTWSDDTSMTIATMDSIAETRGIVNYENVMTKFSQWYKSGLYTAGGKVFDIGNTTYSAINRYNNGIPATVCGDRDESCNGNGSLMRMLPLVFALNNETKKEETTVINKVSGLTHAHEISKLGCKIYFDYMKLLLDNYSKEEAYEMLRNNDYSDYYSQDSISKYDRILKDNIKELKEEDIKSSGYVVDTLEASLWVVLNSSSYEEAVLKAVNLGDDTDTIGAIAGSIAGLLYGIEKIPNEWLEQLKNKDLINRIIGNYYKALNNRKISGHFTYNDIAPDTIRKK